jgi:hypothetical protein
MPRHVAKPRWVDAEGASGLKHGMLPVAVYYGAAQRRQTLRDTLSVGIALRKLSAK